jgi:hypothetical protein
MKATRLVLTITAAIMILLVTACSKNVVLYKQALSLYNKGQFEASLDKNVESLMLKRDYGKAQDLIRNSYPKVIADREEMIGELMKSTNEAKWDQLTEHYQALDSIQKKVKPLSPLFNPKTGVSYTFQITDYSTQLAESTNKAAEYHYSRGVSLARSSTNPEIQKEAAREFVLAQKFVPNYKDSAARYESSRQQAIKRIAIIPFEDKSGTSGKYGGISDILIESVIGNLVQDKQASEFMEIIAREQMNAVLSEQQLSASGLINESTSANIGELVGAHEILTGKILQIIYTAPRTTSVDLKESANVVVSQETYTDENGEEKTRDVRGDVFCNYKKFTKSASLKMTVSYTIVDVATGKIKLQETVNSDNPWSEEWARKVNGDDRALKPATKALIAKAEPVAPADTEMINTNLREISNNIISKIKQYVQ